MSMDKKHFDIVMAIASLLIPPRPGLDERARRIQQSIRPPNGLIDKQFVTAAEIAAELDEDPRLVGNVLDEMMRNANVTKSRCHGYRVDELLKYFERSEQAMLDDFNRAPP